LLFSPLFPPRSKHVLYVNFSSLYLRQGPNIYNVFYLIPKL
jgi:hypothetical protein